MNIFCILNSRKYNLLKESKGTQYFDTVAHCWCVIIWNVHTFAHGNSTLFLFICREFQDKMRPFAQFQSAMDKEQFFHDLQRKYQENIYFEFSALFECTKGL